jgi:uncharacterized membrane protein
VYKDIEWKTIPVFEKHIVAFQVRLTIHTVHDYAISTQTLEEFFKHMIIIQQIAISVKKKPYRE